MTGFLGKAVAALRSSPEKTDVEVRQILISGGIEPQIAKRLVLFLPMAYCRLLLEPLGVRFSATFQHKLPDGQTSVEEPLSSDPLWCSAASFARDEFNAGLSAEALIIIAGRSAEFHAVNQLLNTGSNPKNIVLGPALVNCEDT